MRLSNGSPFIYTDISLNAKILSTNSHTNSLSNQDLRQIKSYTESYVKDKVQSYLYKTAQEFKSDIDSFGRYTVSYFNTWDKWMKYNWLDNYQNSFFNVNIHVNLSCN